MEAGMTINNGLVMSRAFINGIELKSMWLNGNCIFSCEEGGKIYNLYKVSMSTSILNPVANRCGDYVVVYNKNHNTSTASGSTYLYRFKNGQYIDRITVTGSTLKIVPYNGFIVVYLFSSYDTKTCYGVSIYSGGDSVKTYTFTTEFRNLVKEANAVSNLPIYCNNKLYFGNIFWRGGTGTNTTLNVTSDDTAHYRNFQLSLVFDKNFNVSESIVSQYGIDKDITLPNDNYSYMLNKPIVERIICDSAKNEFYAYVLKSIKKENRIMYITRSFCKVNFDGINVTINKEYANTLSETVISSSAISCTQTYPNRRFIGDYTLDQNGDMSYSVYSNKNYFVVNRDYSIYAKKLIGGSTDDISNNYICIPGAYFMYDEETSKYIIISPYDMETVKTYYLKSNAWQSDSLDDSKHMYYEMNPQIEKLFNVNYKRTEFGTIGSTNNNCVCDKNSDGLYIMTNSNYFYYMKL